MNLVVFNMSNYCDWQTGVVNRNFFIVRQLIKRPKIKKIVLVDFLAIQSIKKIFGKKRSFDYAKHVFGADKRVEKLGAFHNIIKLDDSVFDTRGKEVYLLRGLGLWHSPKKLLNKLEGFLKRQDFNTDNTILWSYNAFLPEALDLSAKIKVFDTVDNWAEHASYKKEADVLRQNYKKIDQKADLIFTVSEGLLSLYKKNSAHWIPNGVDLDNFLQDTKDEKALILPNKPIIGYVGTIQERIDFKLIKYLANRHKDKQFIFIGPIWSGVESEVDHLVELCPNIIFYGRRPYRELPQLFKQVDVTIIPHRLDAFLESTNPMKMYDYLAAGKPIVTTPGAGTEMFANIISICDTNEGFSQAIDRELQQDSAEKRAQRREAVKPHVWSRRVEEMMGELRLKN